MSDSLELWVYSLTQRKEQILDLLRALSLIMILSFLIFSLSVNNGMLNSDGSIENYINNFPTLLALSILFTVLAISMKYLVINMIKLMEITRNNFSAWKMQMEGKANLRQLKKKEEQLKMTSETKNVYCTDCGVAINRDVISKQIAPEKTSHYKRQSLRPELEFNPRPVEPTHYKQTVTKAKRVYRDTSTPRNTKRQYGTQKPQSEAPQKRGKRSYTQMPKKEIKKGKRSYQVKATKKAVVDWDDDNEDYFDDDFY